MITSANKREFGLMREYDHSDNDGLEAKAIIEEFFTNFTLQHAKDDLWQLIRASMGDRTGGYDEVSHLFYVYEWLHDLLIASYLVARKDFLKREKENAQSPK